MRKIILNLCTSLDGYIEGPNGEIDWCFMDQDYGMKAFLERVDTIFFGRKSYELQMKLMPDGFPDHQHVVFSQTLEGFDGVRMCSGDLKQQVQAIREEPGKDIWLFGGAGLVQSFLEADLVDEMMIAVHPLLLGGGKLLFQELSERKMLTLLSAKEYSSGLVMMQYQL